jgi:hypothetical protein
MAFFGWNDIYPSQVLILLKRTRELFVRPERWIYFPFALDANGNEVIPTDAAAVQWALTGALDKFAQGSPAPDFLSCAARDFLNDISGGQLVRGKLTYEDELILLDLAIEHLTKELSK